MKKFARDDEGNLYLHRKPYTIWIWKNSSKVLDYLEYDYVLHFGGSTEIKSGFDSEEEACEAVIKRTKKLLEEALEKLKLLYEEME